jgi:hypothetical protein
MKSTEIQKESLEKFQKKASEKAVRENKALGLSYIKVENDMLVEVAADGTVTQLRKSRFGMVKVVKKSYKLRTK